MFYFKHLRRTKKRAIHKLNPDGTLHGLVLKYIYDEKFNFLKTNLAIIILYLPGLDIFMNKMLSNVSIMNHNSCMLVIVTLATLKRL